MNEPGPAFAEPGSDRLRLWVQTCLKSERQRSSAADVAAWGATASHVVAAVLAEPGFAGVPLEVALTALDAALPQVAWAALAVDVAHILELALLPAVAQVLGLVFVAVVHRA